MMEDGGPERGFGDAVHTVLATFAGGVNPILAQLPTPKLKTDARGGLHVS